MSFDVNVPWAEGIDNSLQHAMWGTSFNDNPVDQTPNETQQIGEMAETPPKSAEFACPDCGFDCDRITQYNPSQPCPKCGNAKLAVRERIQLLKKIKKNS